MTVKIELEGLEEAIGEKTSKLLDFARLYIEAEAKRRCPVETGSLKSSIYSRMKSPTEAEVVAPKSYAGFVEYGTPQMVEAHGAHDPNNPVTDWEAKRRRGGGAKQTMPFMRPAIYTLEAKLEGFDG